MRTDPPAFTDEELRTLAAEHFGLTGEMSRLPSERDQNARFEGPDGDWVFKVGNAAESVAEIEMQTAALVHLASAKLDVPLPTVRRSADGAALVRISNSTGGEHVIRAIGFLPGRTWATLPDHPPALLRSLGRVVGQVDAALCDYAHPSATRSLRWDLAQAGWAVPFVDAIDDAVVRDDVAATLTRFSTILEPALASLPVGVVHNDANEHNILVVGSGTDGYRVSGLIDFGDMVRTQMVNGLAVAGAYAIMNRPDPLTAARHVVEGYCESRPLSAEEADVLGDLIAVRLALTITTAALNAGERPGDPYQQVSSLPARRALRQLRGLSPVLVRAAMRDAAGHEPHPDSPRVSRWIAANTASFAAVIEPDPRTSSTFALDLSVASLQLGGNGTYEDEPSFSAHVAGLMERAGAVIGVGAYGEPRPIYSSDAFEAEGNDGPEWRTVHLGHDLFIPAGSAVFAPLAATVHSVGNNSSRLDYGGTIVLRHDVTDEHGPLSFHTLCGHLDPEVALRLRPGQHIAAGEMIARIGSAPFNGDWPPHLHFQISIDMLGKVADMDGACRVADQRIWFSLCPDPEGLSGVTLNRRGGEAGAAGQLLAARSEWLGASLSLAYRSPLHLVRGYRQHLFDAGGRRYLDAVNNVAHVGHSHPEVVAAGARQMAVLNTNSRYLHPTIVEYARRLTDLLPDPLHVVYFVCSGSEANELALRMAHAATGSVQRIVMDAGYHGNTAGLVDVSAYKFNGVGGRGAPTNIHVVPIPDVYRSGGSPAAVAAASTASVGAAVDSIVAMGDRPTLLVESVMGSAGQIPHAAGFLSGAYDHVRRGGGVCIADEVQVGFGRLGSHFWGFETHGVVPDIVTMGKPIGNGHPLAAVVTTPQIADAFANGMEYFNTFGGNPVSCSIGLAVLDVIDREGLQQNAVRVGGTLREALVDMSRSHELIGDVRGSGLFLGVELVRDRSTKGRAIPEAAAVANRMSELGVLVSTDFNTLKIKPPMCVDTRDAERIVDALDRALRYVAG